MNLKKLQSLFERTTSGGAVLKEIDGLRFFAIMGVVLFHFDYHMWLNCPEEFKTGSLSKLIHFVFGCGNFGVPLFFGISGFILMVPFFRHGLAGGKEVSLKKFYLRRVTRLEPPYILNMILLAVLYFLMMGKSASYLAQHLAAHLTYTHNIFFPNGAATGNSINSVAWSLEIEVQFYLLAPLIACIYCKMQPALRRTLLVLIALCASGLESFSQIPILSLLTLAHFFCAGILAADLFVSASNGAVSQGSGLKLGRFDFLALIAFGLWQALSILPQPIMFLVRPLIVFLLLIAALRGPLFRRFLSIPLVYLIGGMCYTIYLWHGPLWRQLWRLISGFTVTFDYPLYFVLYGSVIGLVILVFCAICFLLCEKPFMQRDWPARLAAWVRSRF